MTTSASCNQRHTSNNIRIFSRIFRAIATLVSELPSFLVADATDHDNEPQFAHKRGRDSDSESENGDPPHHPKRRRVGEPCGPNSAVASLPSLPSTSRRRLSTTPRSRYPQPSPQSTRRQPTDGQGHRPLRRSYAFSEHQPWTFGPAGVRRNPSSPAIHDQDTSDTSPSPSPELHSSGTPPTLPLYSRHPRSGDCTVASGVSAAPPSESAAPATTSHEPPPPYSPNPISGGDNQETGSSTAPSTQPTSAPCQQYPTDTPDVRSSDNHLIVGRSSSPTIPAVAHTRAPRSRVNPFGAVIYDDPDLIYDNPSSDSEDTQMRDEDNDLPDSRALSNATQYGDISHRTPTRVLHRKSFAVRYALLHQEVARQAWAHPLESDRRRLLTPPIPIPDQRRQPLSTSIDAMARRKRSRAHTIGEDLGIEAAHPTTRRKHTNTPDESSPFAPLELVTTEREESKPSRVPHPSSSSPSPGDGSISELRHRSRRNMHPQTCSSLGSSSVAARREESNPTRVPPPSPAEGSSLSATRGRRGREEQSSLSSRSMSSPSSKKKSKRR